MNDNVRNDYRVGSEIWYKVSGLDESQRGQLIDVMEEDILQHKRPYDDAYFYWLLSTIQETEAMSYREHEQLVRQIDRIKWLRERNIHTVYSVQEQQLIKKLGCVIPKSFLDDLIELADVAANMKSDLETVKTTPGLL